MEIETLKIRPVSSMAFLRQREVSDPSSKKLCNSVDSLRKRELRQYSKKITGVDYHPIL